MFKNELRFFFRRIIPLLGIAVMAAGTWTGVTGILHTEPFSFRFMNLSSNLAAMGAAGNGATYGSLIIAFLTLVCLSQDKRKNTEVLLLSTADSKKILKTRLLVLFCYAVLLTVVGIIMTFLRLMLLKIPLISEPILTAFLLVTFPALLLTLLLCSGIYLISDSMDISILTFAVVFLLNIFVPDYRLKWVSSHVSWFSDMAGFDIFIKPLLYARSLAFLSFGTIFVVGLLVRRHHGFRLLDSVRKQKNKLLLISAALLLEIGGVTMLVSEPFLDPHSPLLKQVELSSWGSEEDLRPATQEGSIDLLKQNADVVLDPEKATLQGSAGFWLEPVSSDREIEFIINDGLKAEEVLVDQETVSYRRQNGRLTLTVPAGASEILLSYQGRIKSPSLLSLPGYIGNNSIYLQEGSYWMPQLSDCRAGEIMITGTVTVPSKLMLAVPGTLIGVRENGDLKTWEYEARTRVQELALYGGIYQMDTFESNGVVVEVYYSPAHHQTVRDSHLNEMIDAILTFYTEQIGPYHYQAPLKIIETALYKSGGHSSMNLVTVAETVFNFNYDEDMEKYSFDMFVWQMGVELLAHEIAHQWWGSGVPVKMEVPWSSEGLASYTANRFIASYYGEEIALQSGKYPWISSVMEYRNSYFSSPEQLDQLSKAKRNQVEANQMHTQLYYEMPLLLMQMEEFKGEEAFREALASIYQNHKSGELTYQQFLDQVGVKEEEVSIDELFED